MLSRRSFLSSSILGIFASLSTRVARAAPISFAEESAPCHEVSHDLIFKKEAEILSIVGSYTATVRTEFQITKINPFLLVFHR